MTPMLDIVFIMLIFFIVTASFLDESGIDITQLPPPIEPSGGSPSITVYVDAKTQCSVEGSRTECDRVSLAVERVLAEKPVSSIVLRVHEAAQHGRMITLKDEFNESGLGSKIEIVRS